MRRNPIRISPAMLVTIFVLVGVLFLLVPERITGKFHDVFVYSFSPVLKIGTQARIGDITEKFTPEKVVPYSKYEKLLEEKQNLQSKLSTLRRNMIDLHKRYELATGTRQRLPDVGPGHIWAEVITYLPEKNELDINRGRQDGLKSGQYVIGQDYLIGTVAQVNVYSAKVKLLTAAEHELIVEIEAKDSKGKDIYRRAVMKGNGKNSCVIKGVQTAYQIKKGNFVYAYARPGYLNSPLIIGKVNQIQHDESDPLFWDIEVKPSFQIEKLNRVFAVTTEPVKRGDQ